MRSRITSLRGHLVLGAIAVGLTFAVAFGGAATWWIQHAQDQAIDAALRGRLELARHQVGADGSLRAEPGNLKTDLVQVIGSDGTVVSRTPSLRGVGPLADPSKVGIDPAGQISAINLQTPDVDLATLAVPWLVDQPSTQSRPTTNHGVLVVALDTEGFTTSRSGLIEVLIAGLLIVIFVLAGLSWIVSGRALRSVARLTESAELVRPGDLSAGLPLPKGDAELSRLVYALNRMLGRLDASHATELAFAANAGHRLRTPVATLRAEAELALHDDDPHHRTDALNRIIADADQLTSIVDRMLARGRRAVQRVTPAIALIEDSSLRWGRQAQLAGVDLRLHVDNAAPRGVHCDRILEILDPIVDNAIRHASLGGSVRIAVGPDDDGGIGVTIVNSGAPVPADLAPHVFDAWVSTRDGSQGGGLGLWIARETAHDVGGEITLDPPEPDRTTFRVSVSPDP